MTDAEIFDVVAEAIRNETGNSGVAITPETTAADVPGWDSLAHGRIMLAIEVAVSARFDIEKTYSATCVGELVPIVRSAMASKS